MKYKIGDKVRINNLNWYNENKNDDNCIDLIGKCDNGFDFTETMAAFCGKVMTITNISRWNYYYMLEDSGMYSWTDEMIEGLVEEECPQDFIEKYCKLCGTQRCDRTKEYLDGCSHYNEYMREKQNN